MRLKNTDDRQYEIVFLVFYSYYGEESEVI